MRIKRKKKRNPAPPRGRCPGCNKFGLGPTFYMYNESDKTVVALRKCSRCRAHHEV